MQTEKVMDRKRVAEVLHKILDVGAGLLEKKTWTQDDHARTKAMRAMGTHINASVTMIQQETAQQRMEIIVERMKQLGYEEPKGLKG